MFASFTCFAFWFFMFASRFFATVMMCIFCLMPYIRRVSTTLAITFMTKTIFSSVTFCQWFVCWFYSNMGLYFGRSMLYCISCCSYGISGECLWLYRFRVQWRGFLNELMNLREENSHLLFHIHHGSTYRILQIIFYTNAYR